MSSHQEQPPLTENIRRSLWVWLMGLTVAMGFAVWHANAVATYLDRVTSTRFSATTSSAPLQRVPQAIAPDGQMWIRHTLAMAEQGEWRFRETQVDNAPDGRPIYWNSGWAWWLRGCAEVRRWFTDESYPVALERASAWANLPVLLGSMALLSFWTWRRMGSAAGIFIAWAMVGHRGFYEGLYPAYCDHHGLIAVALLGQTLGVAFAGAGWWSNDRSEKRVTWLPDSRQAVMRAMSVSAICGAVGLWVSAASAVVAIAFTVVVALGVTFTGASRSQSNVAVPDAWRRWGRLGAVCSFGFYLLENFPDRLDLRMEANHPLYSLAWWAAGELVAEVLSWKQGNLSNKALVPRLAIWSSLILASPVVLLINGSRIFTPANPFIGRIHESIHEFQSIAVAVKRTGWQAFGDQLFIAGVLIAASVVWLWWHRSKHGNERTVVTWAIGLTLGATLLGCWQNRWLSTASGAQITLSLLLIMAASCRLRTVAKTISILTFGVLLYAAGPWKLAAERLLVERVRDVQTGEALQLLYREIAGFLRATGADDTSIVLSNPNASVGVGYYGRLRTLGTLYWENAEGLEAAAAILDADDTAEAAALIYARGVTHVVLVSPYDFLDEYSYALHGDKPKEPPRFGREVFVSHRVPIWLRPLNFVVPPELSPLGFSVSIFEVDFTAPPSEAYERIGIYQLTRGDQRAAESSFMSAVAADPSRAEPWLLQGYLLLANGKTAEAYSFIRSGIERAPVEHRNEWIRASADSFARQGAAKESQALLEMNRAEPIQAQ